MLAAPFGIDVRLEVFVGANGNALLKRAQRFDPAKAVFFPERRVLVLFKNVAQQFFLRRAWIPALFFELVDRDGTGQRKHQFCD